MKVFKKQSENLCLQPEDLRAIRSGSAENLTSNNRESEASFPCTVRETDGSTRTKQVSSVQDCLEFAGMG